MAKITDFGEKIEGARKDACKTLARTLAQAGPCERFIALPLSKAWPKLDGARPAAAGSVTAWICAARDELGAKPGRHRLADWALLAQRLSGLAATLANHPWSGDPTPSDVSRFIATTVSQGLHPRRLTRDPQRLGLRLQAIDARALIYVQQGYKISLKRLEFWKAASLRRPYVISLRRGSGTLAGRFGARSWAKAFELACVHEEIARAVGLTRAKTPESPSAKRTRFHVVHYRGDPAAYIAVKIHGAYVRLAQFDGPKTALKAVQNPTYTQTLEERLRHWRAPPFERGLAERPRIGPDYRRGADVTPAEFTARFGFRGVQFGNAMGPARRQDELNRAHDGLMDLAHAIGVAPASLSLGGRLGLAFGARGHGGKNPAAAHFDSRYFVINLTKKKGAGSLAHEWFHALDNHLARTAGPGSDQFASEHHAPGQGAYLGVGNKVRLMLEARSRLLDQTRSKPYWSTTREIMARAFEASVKRIIESSGGTNDYLANIMPETTWQTRHQPLSILMAPESRESGATPSDYPYPLPGEADAVMRLMLTFIGQAKADSAL